MGKPLLSWDIFTEGYQQLLQSSRQVRKDLADIERLARQHKWQQSFEYQPYLISPRNAIIITNITEHIVWVSHNFEQMTGYTPAEVQHKKPSLLQGENTSSETRAQVRQLLALVSPVQEVQLLNYKKNGTPYLCSLQIFPIHNKAGQLIHFIAFETEVG
jgi:PAS domain S-box-containing protein